MDILNTKIKSILTEKNTKILPANIKKDVNILGVTGILEEGVDTSDATATAGDILAGKSAYVDGSKINGSYIPLDTSDADATVSDLAKNKTAYVSGSKITGTLQTINANAAGAYLNPSAVSITDKPQFRMLDCYFTFTADVLHRKNSKEQLNFFYDYIIHAIGLTAAKIKKNETVLGLTGTYEGEPPTGTINITENGQIDVSQYANANVNVQAQSEYNASVDELLTGNSGDFKSNITELPELDLTNLRSTYGYFQSCSGIKELKLKNTQNITSFTNFCFMCSSLERVSELDCTSAINIANMFAGCLKLKDIKLINTQNVTSMGNMFNQCTELTNESLNNILAMCISATSYTGTKTLAYLGLTSAQATTCQGLSNYQAFLNAGWTTGY